MDQCTNSEIKQPLEDSSRWSESQAAKCHPEYLSNQGDQSFSSQLPVYPPDACDARLSDLQSIFPIIAQPHVQKKGKRLIVIDGSNVAMSHGNDSFFSWPGIDICVRLFLERSHPDVVAFVPGSRKEFQKASPNPARDQAIIDRLVKGNHLKFTPARKIQRADGSLDREISYDDPIILSMASDHDGVVVSNDFFRDLINVDPRFRKVIEERTIGFTFYKNTLCIPTDLHGRRSGMTVEQLLDPNAPSRPAGAPAYPISIKVDEYDDPHPPVPCGFNSEQTFRQKWPVIVNQTSPLPSTLPPWPISSSYQQSDLAPRFPFCWPLETIYPASIPRRNTAPVANSFFNRSQNVLAQQQDTVPPASSTPSEDYSSSTPRRNTVSVDKTRQIPPAAQAHVDSKASSFHARPRLYTTPVEKTPTAHDGNAQLCPVQPSRDPHPNWYSDTAPPETTPRGRKRRKRNREQLKKKRREALAAGLQEVLEKPPDGASLLEDNTAPGNPDLLAKRPGKIDRRKQMLRDKLYSFLYEDTTVLPPMTMCVAGRRGEPLRFLCLLCVKSFRRESHLEGHLNTSTHYVNLMIRDQTLLEFRTERYEMLRRGDRRKARKEADLKKLGL